MTKVKVQLVCESVQAIGRARALTGNHSEYEPLP